MTTGTRKRSTFLYLATVTAALNVVPSAAQAKTPGSTYCFLSKCHRVLTLAETRAVIGKPRVMHASHYDAPSRDRFNPSLITSSGELFQPYAPNNAASPIYPDGTLVAVYAPGTKRGAIVRINNAGPYWGNRLIDLSRGLAEKLGIAKSGVGKVVVEVLSAPTKAEATYVRGRRYAAVPGFIGKVASIETVRDNWQIRQGITAPVMVAAGQKPAAVPATVAAAVVIDTAVSLAASPEPMRPDLPPLALAPLTLAPLTLGPVVALAPQPVDGKRPAPSRKLSQPAQDRRARAQPAPAKLPAPIFR